MYKTDKTVGRIKKLAKLNGIKITDMLNECELNKNVLSSMQSRGSWIQANNLARIADYLDCSVDYLLGRVDEPELGIKKAPLHGGAAAQDNILRLAGRDGRYLEKTLTPEQMDLFFKMLEQLPDADTL